VVSNFQKYLKLKYWKKEIRFLWEYQNFGPTYYPVILIATGRQARDFKLYSESSWTSNGLAQHSIDLSPVKFFFNS
jgi:hypothetical protein